MDKYEFNLKIDQIKKLVEKKDYKTASKVGKTLELHKIKDWQLFALLIQVHDAAGDLEEAREAAVIAYNKNLGGRRLVYKLADICLRLKDYDEANELFKDYTKMASRDPSRYVLEYKLLKAQKAPAEDLIDVLETYREHEIDEKYLCELANLYSNTGRIEECVEECDEIITLFRDGVYVNRAMRLKQQYVELTPAQKKLLDDAQRMEAQQALEREQEKTSDDVKRFQDDVNEEPQQEVTKQITPVVTQQAEADKETEQDSKEEIKEADDFAAEADIETAAAREEAAEQDTQEEVNETESVGEMPENLAGYSGDVNDYAQSNAAIAAANASIQQMIDEARDKIDDSYEQVQRQEEQEKKENEMSNISVPVHNYGIYDTQTLQAELVNSMSEILKEENKPAQPAKAEGVDEAGYKAAGLTKEDAYGEANGQETENEADDVEEQIEGQLSIEDWIEAVREEKYSRQQTKEFSRAELERVLEKREQELEEYEKLKAKLKEDEGSARSNNDELKKVILNAVKTDLAIRTGKATAKLEEDVKKARLDGKARREAARIRAEQEAEEEKKRQAEARRVQLEKQRAEEEKARLEREEEAVRAVEEALAQETYNEIAAAMSEADDNVTEQVEQTIQQAVAEADAADTEPEEEESEEIAEETNNYSDAAPMHLPEAVKKYFKKFEDVENLEKILVGFYTEVVLRSSEKDSSSGNIIISGSHNTDKTGLAMSIVKGINVLFPEKPRKIARTTGESINTKGITKSLSRLLGTVLIIEDAGSLKKSRVKELLELLDGDTGNMLVILEDAERDITMLLEQTPEITAKFNHKIELRSFTVNEMVEIAKGYAFEQNYTIDDSALLALYLSMDRLNNKNDRIDTADIYEVIDAAIENENVRNSKRLFKRKRGENSNVLLETDFSAE